MLKFPYDFCDDAKANEIVKEFYNNRLIDLMNDHMLTYAEKGYEDIKEDDREFAEYIHMFFPDNYPLEEEPAKFLGLYALLKAEDEFVPELVMEYLLDAMISAQVEMCKDAGTSTVELMPDREYVLEKLLEEPSQDEIEMPEEKLTKIEDIANYEDIIFWDTDFAFLDNYTLEELKNSEVNKMFGIVDNRPDNVFELPKKWIK